MWFMKSRAKFDIEEMLDLAPYEYKLFYHMAIKDEMEREKIAEAERQKWAKMGKLWSFKMLIVFFL